MIRVNNVFNEVKIHIRDWCCLGLAFLPLHRNQPIDLLWKSMGQFLCNDLNIFYCFYLKKKISNYNLVDACIRVFRQEGCKVVATWHRRKNWFIRIWSDINYFSKLILYYLFTILHKVVFKNFAYILGTVNFRYNFLLVRTIAIACMIPCKRLIVPNLILIGVALGRCLEENSCYESFYKTREVINEEFTY